MRTNILVEQEEHAKYSPSKLPRIVACPASGLYERAEDQAATESVYASEGTMLHLVTSEALDNAEMQLTQQTIDKFSLDIPQRDAVQECLDYVVALRENYMSLGADFYDLIETKVGLEGFIPGTGCEELREVRGTLDYALVCNRTLHITDWKFGVGIEVFPESEQLKAYALGKAAQAANLAKFDQIILTIVQPRLYNEEHIKTFTITPQELYYWLEVRLIPALLKIHAKHPIFNPSEKACRWCPIKHNCAARREQFAANALTVFSMHDCLPSVDVNHILEILDKAGDIRAYLKDIEQFAFRRCTQGLPVGDYKIVHGKSNRSWKDEGAVQEWCMNQGLDMLAINDIKLKSPAQIEKMLKKPIRIREDFTSLVIKPDGKPTMVRGSDKREAIDYRTVAEIFSEIDMVDEID